MTHQILVLDSRGTPQSWVKWKAAVRYRVRGQIAWSCGDESVYHGGLSRLTGVQSTIAVPSIIAVRAAHRVLRRVPQLTNRALFGRDLHTCGYCGRRFPEAGHSYDRTFAFNVPAGPRHRDRTPGG